MTSIMAFAEFLDRCCGQYAKRPDYRRKLESERPKWKPRGQVADRAAA